MAYNRFDNVYKKAEELGAVVVVPGPREIFIDLDTAADQYILEALVPMMGREGFPVEIVEMRKSMSGFHKHAILRASWDLHPLERLLIQACLGSDRKRELISLIRYKQNILPESVLFRKPGDDDLVPF